MVKCERCGTGFSPIQAAVLEFCPRCKARSQISVPLIAARVKPRSPQEWKAGETPIARRGLDAGQAHGREHAADRQGRADRPGQQDVTAQ